MENSLDALKNRRKKKGSSPFVGKGNVRRKEESSINRYKRPGKGENGNTTNSKHLIRLVNLEYWAPRN